MPFCVLVRGFMQILVQDGTLKVKELSEDQKPDRDDERERIEQFGGRVEVGCLQQAVAACSPARQGLREGVQPNFGADLMYLTPFLNPALVVFVGVA